MAAWFIVLAAAAAAPEGAIAYLAEDASGGRRVMVADLSSGAVHAAGAGPRDGAPHWSPDGAWLAFEHDPGDGRGIALARPDGTAFRNVTPAGAYCFSPAWSPDGRRLAYTRAPSADEGLGQIIRVYNVETGETEAWGAGRAAFLQARWLPNTLFLAVLQGVEEMEGIDLPRFRAEMAGGGLCCILLTPGEEGLQAEPAIVTRSEVLPLSRLDTRGGYPYVAWNVTPQPTRKRLALAFESNDGGDREIFVLTGKRLIDVTNHRAADWNPVWAPGRRQLAFESFRGGSRGVYSVFTDTARVTPVDADPAYDCWAPAWSPGGRYLAYVSNQDGAPGIHLCTAQGGARQTLASLAGAGDGVTARLAPAWRPERTR